MTRLDITTMLAWEGLLLPSAYAILHNGQPAFYSTTLSHIRAHHQAGQCCDLGLTGFTTAHRIPHAAQRTACYPAISLTSKHCVCMSPDAMPGDISKSHSSFKGIHWPKGDWLHSKDVAALMLSTSLSDSSCMRLDMVGQADDLQGTAA